MRTLDERIGMALALPMSVARHKLQERHGNPAVFAIACYNTVPGFCSVAEAEAAIRKYLGEWEAAE